MKGVDQQVGTIGDTLVLANQLLSSKVDAGAVSVSILGAGEWADTKVTAAPIVRASFEGTADIDGGLSVLALYNYDLDDSKGVVKTNKKVEANTYGLAAAGGVSGGGARTTVNVNSSVDARISNANVKATGDVGVSANGSYTTVAYTGNLQGALAAAIGASLTKVENGSSGNPNKVSARIKK